MGADLSGIFGVLAVENIFCSFVPERLNHKFMIARTSCYCKASFLSFSPNVAGQITKVIAEGKRLRLAVASQEGIIARWFLKEAGVQSYEPSLPRTDPGDRNSI